MNNHEELLAKVQSLNAKSKELNTLRQQNIGKKETLQNQLDSYLKKYAEMTGKQLSIDDIDAEIEATAKVLEEDVANVERVISMIESGDYESANKMVGGTEFKNAVESDKSEVLSAPSLSVPDVPVSKPVKEEVPVNEQVPVAPPVVGGITPPSSVETPVNQTEDSFLQGLNPEPSSPTVPNVFTQTFKNPEEDDDDSDTDVKPAAPPSFAEVLNGSNFEA